MFYNYDLEKIVRSSHVLRKVKEIVAFNKIVGMFRDSLKKAGRKGYSLEVGVKSLFLQFFYNLSDRQMEDAMKDNTAYKWFCGFGINETTPDHSYFGRIRKTLGAAKISMIFEEIKKQSKSNGIMREIFTFVDASTIVSKNTTWDERDKAIKEGEDKLNNKNIDKYSADKDARFGCKGKDKFWYGYKRHASVDMTSGLIKKVAVTPENVTDQAGLEHVCPDGGMVFADKQYCCKRAQIIMKSKGCHSGAILKNNMKFKNKDKDKWLTKVRMPFEGTFSRLSKRTRYRGIAKVQMQAVLEAIVFNVKRLIVVTNSPPVVASGA
ncbi:MAG: transposase [Candidatus Omnitrophota bacterium]